MNEDSIDVVSAVIALEWGDVGTMMIWRKSQNTPVQPIRDEYLSW